MKRMSERDLLGHPLTELETEVLELHRRLHALAAHPDATPCVVANARFAAAAVAQIVQDLDLDWGHDD